MARRKSRSAAGAPTPGKWISRVETPPGAVNEDETSELHCGSAVSRVAVMYVDALALETVTSTWLNARKHAADMSSDSVAVTRGSAGGSKRYHPPPSCVTEPEPSFVKWASAAISGSPTARTAARAHGAMAASRDRREMVRFMD